MGYRGQQNREEAEKRRYRLETPPHIRAWHMAVGIVVFTLVVIAPIVLAVWFRLP